MSVYGHSEMLVEGLYRGSVPTPRQAHFYDPFDVIVWCLEDHKSFLSSFTPADRDREIYRVCLDDIEGPTFGLMLDVARKAADRVLAGRKVFIGCVSGQNRSGIVTFFVLVFMGYSPEAAYHKLEMSTMGPPQGRFDTLLRMAAELTHKD